MPVPLRGDFDAMQLRGFARWTKDGPQAEAVAQHADVSRMSK
jgi:hypothetical protein